MSLGRISLIVVALVAWLGAVACNDSTGPGAGTVSLSVTVPSGGGSASVSSPAMFDVVYMHGGSTLTITQVELVLSEIELEMVDDDSCDDGADSDDDCEEFEAGPRVFDLPLDGSTEAVLTINDVPDGLYDELEIEIHKVTTDPEDAALLASRPELESVSIQVVGDLDGTGFEFLTGVEEEFEFEFSPPIDSTAGSINVTLSIDVASWFQAPDGTILDPSLEANRSQIESNIEQSFEAFEDDDRDGDDDGDDDDD